MLSFKLEVFEGPMDLLLRLIEKHKIDIYDIEISLLTQQYMAYIETAEKYNLDLAADFLEMASRLMYVKSCSLLPRQQEEEEDPKALLEAMLQEYAKHKKAAEFLKNRYVGNLLFFRETLPEGLPPVYDGFPGEKDLLSAYRRVIERNERKKPVPVSAFKKLVGTRFVTVASKVLFVLKNLFRTGRTNMKNLFQKNRDRSEIVATFLALLELIRTGRVDVIEEQNKTEIILNRKKKENEVPDADI